MATSASSTISSAASTSSLPSIVALSAALNAPTKLDKNNFTSWKLQIITVLTGHNLLGYITGATPKPSDFLATADGASVSNPAHTHWIQQDALIHHLLLGSVDQNYQPTIQHTTNSKQAWDTLLDTYGKQSKARARLLRMRLNSIEKGTMSISEYFNAIKNISDDLAALDSKVPDDELVEIILKRVGDGYTNLVSALQARDDTISLPLLHEKLLMQEMSLAQSQKASPPAYAAFPAYHNPHHMPVSPNTTYTPYHSAPRPNQPLLPTPPNPTPRPAYYNQPQPSYPQTNSHKSNNRSSRGYHGFCQLCGIQGHVATRFHTHPHYTNLPRPPRIQSGSRPPHAHMAQASTSTAPVQSSEYSDYAPWMLDSGASHHMTQELSLLALHSPYQGFMHGQMPPPGPSQ